MKIKSVSARIIGQRYSGSLSQGDEGGQSPVHLVMTVMPPSFFRHPARTRHIRIKPPDCVAMRTMIPAASGMSLQPITAPLRQLGVHPDTTHTTASPALQNS